MNDIPSRLQNALQDRYRVERELGEGGMATVYLAEDLRHDRKVAVKVLKPELAAVVGADRFLVEIKTTANLQHPHILPLHDSGEAEGLLYYVMPYVRGESLRARLDREHQLPVDEAVQITRTVAEALDYAHAQGVLHRDIKPENILLQAGKPVVTDFGIALAVGAAGGARLTETGLSLGTPHYMSPEQATGDQHLGPSTDVYALGCVSHEMLVGEPPYTGSTPQAVLGRIITADVPAASAERKSVPLNVDSAIRCALEKLPADRFRSTAGFADALGDPGFRYERSGQRASVPGSGVSWGRAPGLARWLSAWPSQAALAALAIVTLLLLIGLPDPPAEPPARALFPLDLGSLEIPSEMTLSPDGRTLIFVSRPPDSAWALYRRRSDEEEITRIPGTEHASDPQFSPDGQWVVFVQDRMELKRWPVEGGVPLNIPIERGTDGNALNEGAILEDPSWGPDGSILFAAYRGLYQVPANGGTPEQILPRLPFSSFLPRLVEGTNRILYTYQVFASMDPEVRLLDLESRDEWTIVAGSDGRYLPEGYLLYVTLDGSLVAARFDPDQGELTGRAIPLIEHVGMGPSAERRTHLAVAEAGDAVYAVGDKSANEEILVELGLDGGEDMIPGLPVGNYSGPRYDPTGSRIAFELGGQLLLRNLVLGNQSVLLPDWGYNPIWSRDGARIAYGYSPPDTLTPSQLLIRPSDLSSGPEVVLESPFFIPPSAWTPLDSFIVYTGGLVNADGSGAEIWYAPPTPQAEGRPFLRASGWDQGFASISPDGRWAAYDSNVTGRPVVYVQSFPVPGEPRQLSEGEGVGGRWAADGERIFYRSGDTVKVAHVRTEPDFAVVRHEVLFTGRYNGIEPHPDGTRLLAIKRLSGPDSAQDRRLLWGVNLLDSLLAPLEGG
ncbi:MAG: protein kinase [Gemmatimonadota bacterium]